MTRPCICDKCDKTKGSAYKAGECRLCWNWHHDAQYRSLWSDSVPASGARAVSSCKHFGEATGETLPCSSCNGNVSLKLFKCGVYGECTAGKSIRGVACCKGCPDYAPGGGRPVAAQTVEGHQLGKRPALPTRPLPPRSAPPPPRPKVIPTPHLDRPSGSSNVSGEASTPLGYVGGLRWAYGVTTVPSRLIDLLPATLASLAKAGFDKPRLFVDGASGGEEWRLPYEITFRYPRIRAYGNWILGLAELYIRNPMADRYAMFQDDFVTYPNLKKYLESVPYPVKGYLNLYTFPSNQTLAPKDGAIGFYPADQLGKGAVALVFDRDAIVTLITHEHMVNKARSAEKHYSWKSIDGGVVTAMRKAGYKEYVHNPSLVQHRGEVTTLSEPGFRHPRQLQSVSFRGENYDALELLK